MGVATDLNNQLLLIQRVGDIDFITADPISPLTAGANGLIMINAERIWNKYLPYQALRPASLGQQIFDYYFMIAATEIVLGVLRSRVDFSAVGTAMRVMLSQRTKSYETLLAVLMAGLAVREQKLAAFAQPVLALITQVEPILPPVPGQLSSPTTDPNPWIIDANDPGIQGSPYWPAWRPGSGRW